MIREKPRGFGANVWDLIGNQIIFQLENAWTDSTSTWTGGAFGPPWTRGESAAGARRSAHRAVLRGAKAHRGGAGRERVTARSSPRPKSGGAVARLRRRRRGSEFGGGARCGASGGTEKQNKDRHELWCAAVMR
jgi:hypothetical protein